MYLLNSKKNIQKVHVLWAVFLTRFLYEVTAQYFNSPKRNFVIKITYLPLSLSRKLFSHR